MQKIAILLTCYNRKNKTLSALSSLQKAAQCFKYPLKISVYLTDDGSTDGTSEAVRASFPKVVVLPGTGSLYWAGGMHNSWKEAVKKEYNGFLLINDDTDVYEDLFIKLKQTEEHCVKHFGQKGIYIGSTRDPKTGNFTYGGGVITNKFLFKRKMLQPNDTIQECQVGNANIMYVSSDVVKKIGILSNKYIHGLADFDYTLEAVKNKIPVLIASDYCGYCTHDHQDFYKNFSNMKFKDRVKLMKSPTGLD